MDILATQIAPRSLVDTIPTQLRGVAACLLPILPKTLTHSFLRMAQQNYLPKPKIVAGVTLEQVRTGSARVIWIERKQQHRGVIVYVHGGAYICGPMDQQWKWLVEIQRQTKFAVASIIYRMPPDHPFPAAVEDATTSITHMIDSGDLRPGRWILAGDSAGGGLAITTELRLLDQGTVPPPVGLVLTAPWVDLSMRNPELAISQQLDPLLYPSWLAWAARLYAGNMPLEDWRLSPINGPFADFPPVHLAIGTCDMFLPDVRRLRDKLRYDGIKVDYIEQAGGIHNFVQLVHTPEGRRATAAQAEWILQHVGVESAESAMLQQF